jgi:hypothetical protein
MNPTKASAAGLLAGGLALAVGTPVYLARAEPDLAGYLMHPQLLLLQAVPYLLCAGLWLPWPAPSVGTAALVLSGLLLLGAALVYVPMLLDPRSVGGDMVGLGFLAIAAVTTAALAAASLGAFGLLRWRRRHDHLRTGGHP